MAQVKNAAAPAAAATPAAPTAPPATSEKSAAPPAGKTAKAAKKGGTAAAPPAPRQGRRKPGAIDRMHRQLGHIVRQSARMVHVLGVWNKTPSANVAIRGDVAGAVNLSQIVAEKSKLLEVALARLIEAGYSPEAPPPPPKVAVGQPVRVKKERVEQYTKHGLYEKGDVNDLIVTAIGGVEARCLVKGTEREIHIRHVNHLEPMA